MNILILANYKSPHLPPWLDYYKELDEYNFFFLKDNDFIKSDNFTFVNAKAEFNYFEIKKIIKKHEIELVIAHSAGKIGLLALLLNIPYIVRIYGTELYITKKVKYRKWIMNLVLGKAKRIGTSSENATNFIENNYQMKYKTSTIYLPATKEYSNKNYSFEVKKQKLENFFPNIEVNEKTKIFFINRRIGDIYNSDKVAKIFSKYLEYNSNAYLILLNSFTVDFNNLELVKKEISKNTEENQKRFLFIDNPVNYTELDELYNCSDCFISVPSTDQLSRSIVEGMKSECTPILSDTKSYEDINNGFGFPKIRLDENMESDLINMWKNIDNINFEFDTFNKKYNSDGNVISIIRKHFNKALGK